MAFLSNKPLHTRADYAAKLTRLGIPTRTDEVVNSSIALARHLGKLDPGAPASGDLDASGLPRIIDDWRMALDGLAVSDAAARLLGAPLRDLYVRVKRAEYRRYQRFVSDFDRDFYRPHI